jgi:hypothetical protein
MSQVANPPRLSDFFLRLADERALLDEHTRDPAPTMAAAGLTVEQIDTVLAGDVDRVREALEAEVTADPSRKHVVVTPRMTLHTPKPGPPDPPDPPGPPPKPGDDEDE